MSIQKLDTATLRKSQIPYTQVLNTVVQNLRNRDALVIWVYLSSMPSDWIISKEQIRRHFKIGTKAAKNAFAELKRRNLISYANEKDDKGRIIKWYMDLLDGMDFVVDNLEEKPKKSTTKKSKSTGSKTTRVETHASGKDIPTKEIENKKRNKKEKKKYIATRVFFPPKSTSSRAVLNYASVDSQSTSYKPMKETKKAPRSEEAEAAWKIARRIAGAKGYSCK